MGKTANREPATPAHETPAPAPAALIALARLLARHAAHDALASAQPAAASEIDQSEPEDTREDEA